MAKTWAEECAERWADDFGGLGVLEVIRGAVREALAKAVEVAEAEHLEDPEPGVGGPDDCYDHAINDAVRAIRALCAKP